eukprot:PhF_6_TR36318/c0_g1_i2/m.53124
MCSVEALTSKSCNGVRCLYVDGDTLYSGSDDTTIRVWDTYGRDVVEWKGHSKGVHHLATTPGLLWSGGEDGTLRIWDKATGECLQVRAAPHTGPITQMQCVGSRVWTSSMGVFYVWDTINFGLVAEFTEHKAYVTAATTVATSIIARMWSMSSDGQIAVWNAEVCLEVDESRMKSEVERRTREVVYLKDALLDVEQQSNRAQLELEAQINKLKQNIHSLEDHVKKQNDEIENLGKELQKK